MQRGRNPRGRGLRGRLNPKREPLRGGLHSRRLRQLRFEWSNGKRSSGGRKRIAILVDFRAVDSTRQRNEWHPSRKLSGIESHNGSGHQYSDWDGAGDLESARHAVDRGTQQYDFGDWRIRGALRDSSFKWQTMKLKVAGGVVVELEAQSELQVIRHCDLCHKPLGSVAEWRAMIGLPRDSPIPRSRCGDCLSESGWPIDPRHPAAGKPWAVDHIELSVDGK